MLVLDTETTTLNKGNPFDYRNKLCYVGLFDGSTYSLLDIHYSSSLSRKNLGILLDRLLGTDLIVGFNLKFDLHWLRRYGSDFSHCRVWDCQLVEFILSDQTLPYPSLDESADRRGLGTKLDIVDREYWSKGIDTPDVPREILEEYLKQDLLLTYKLYQDQLEEIEKEEL